MVPQAIQPRYFVAYWFAQPGTYQLIDKMLLVCMKLGCTLLADEAMVREDGCYLVPFVFITPSRAILNQCLEDLKPYIGFTDALAIEKPSETALPFMMNDSMHEGVREVRFAEDIYERLGQYNEAVVHRTPMCAQCFWPARFVKGDVLQTIISIAQENRCSLFYLYNADEFKNPAHEIYATILFYMADVLQAETIYRGISQLLPLKLFTWIYKPPAFAYILLTTDVIDVEKATPLDEEHIVEFVQLAEELGLQNQQRGYF